MEPLDDILLKRYVREGDQAAFAALARRHLDLVFGVCRRELGDPTRAEDACQSVFLLLARRAPRLLGRSSLAGWLFESARLVCRNLAREEARRHRRERAAVSAVMISTVHDLWSELEPRLNDALAKLRASDREAICLRFLEGRSLAEVGHRLGLTENAARMRVQRAVERLRANLGRAGLVLTSIALTDALSRASAQAAPADFLSRVEVLGAPGSSPAPALEHLAKGAQIAMSFSTTKKVAVLVVVALGLFGGAKAAYDLRQAPKQVKRVVAPARNGKLSHDFLLPLLGEWRGVLKYRDYESNRLTAINTTATIALAAGESAAVITARYDSQGQGQQMRLVLSEDGRRLTFGSAEDQETFQVTGAAEFAEAGAGEVVMLAMGTDDDRPAELRRTLIRKGDRFILRGEFRRRSTDPWTFRNEYDFRRIEVAR